MTRREAEDILTSVGCIDPKNLGCAHIAYARWIELYGRGLVPWKPVADAYLRVKQVDTAQEQLTMFVEKGADL